jgi:hypothetical protein
MKRNTLSFLVVGFFTVIAGIAAQVNAASQPQNLLSIQAQANASQAVPLRLRTQAQIVMKGGETRDGRVVKIDRKGQKLWIQASGEQRSLPLSQIENIIFPKSTPPPKSNRERRYRHGILPQAEAIWNNIPMSAFDLKNAAKGEAVVQLSSPVVNSAQLKYILNVPKNKRFFVDEMRFNVQKKTMTIVVTPY